MDLQYSKTFIACLVILILCPGEDLKVHQRGHLCLNNGSAHGLCSAFPLIWSFDPFWSHPE